MKAKLALSRRLLNYVNNPFCLAGLTIAISINTSHGQQDVFRVATVQLPALTVVPVQETSRNPGTKTDSEKASNPSDDVTRVKPEDALIKDADQSNSSESRGQAKPANRDPLVLPKLTIPNTSIQGIGTGTTPEDLVEGRLPGTISLPYGPDRYGFWALGAKTWTAPVFCHQPVYFEDTMLERHGHERFGFLQPVASGARFFSNIAFLPYQAWLQPPLEERYSAGHFRMGSAAPCIRQRPPYDAGALRFQLLTTGTAVLIAQP